MFRKWFKSKFSHKSEKKNQQRNLHMIFLSGLFLAAFGLLLLLATGHTIITNWHSVESLQQQQTALTHRAFIGTALVGGGFVGMMWGTQGWNALDVREDLDDQADKEGVNSTINFADSMQSPASACDQRWVEHNNLCCHRCHAVNDSTARFCDQCGQKLRESAKALVV